MKNTIKILTYNIHKGFSLGNRSFVLEKIREGIRLSGADLVFLQELQGYHVLHSKKVNKEQLEFLADGVWKHFSYGKNAVYEKGHHGNALLSHYPVASFHNLDISTNGFEKRGLLHAVIENDGFGHIHLFNTHLYLLHASRQKQIFKIINYIQSKTDNKDKIILAGDFNDWPEKLSKILHQELGLEEVFLKLAKKHALSFPSTRAFLALDRIYFKGIEPKSAEVLSGSPWSKLSDHLALSCEFYLNQKALTK